MSDQEIFSDFSQEDIQSIIDAMADGFTPAEAAGVEQARLEALYALGHSLYSSGEYQDAETAFRALCLYDYRDNRFWMGLGASLQAQNKLALATEVYSMAGLATSLKDPAPFYYAGLCFLKMGDLESADGSFSAMEVMGEPGNDKDEAFKAKAANLRVVIAEKKNGGEAK
jgi:type III secretion system low calcium response chaperone LcrH/SycD